MIRGICNTRHATTFDWLGRRGGGATCRHAWNAAVRGVAAVTQGPLSPAVGRGIQGLRRRLMPRSVRVRMTLSSAVVLLMTLVLGLPLGPAATQAAGLTVASDSVPAVGSVDGPGHHFGFTQASVLGQTTVQQTLTSVAATATRQAAITQPITGALAQSALTAVGFTAGALQSCVGFGSGANIGGNGLGIGFNPAGPIGGPGFGNPVGPIGGFGASNFGVGGGVGGNVGTTCQVTGGV